LRSYFFLRELGVKKHPKSTRIVILDRKWKVTFHTPEEYLRKVADDSKAEIDYDNRTLDVDLQYLSHELIAHELTHSYAKERSINETEITLKQMEEFFCEVVGKHVKTINRQADILLRMGRKLKWRKQTSS
jgi:hypothetical protein